MSSPTAAPAASTAPSPIHPTPGRVVWYYPYQTDAFPKPNSGEPLAAIVARVWSDTCVNLAVFDANGNLQSKTSVLLVQPGNPVPDSGYCAWMPYQVGQAQRTREAEERAQV